MKKVLIIAYYWPPAGGPGVQRWLKFAKYLPEFGIQPIVYVPENPSYPIIDNDLDSNLPKEVIVIKQPIFEPYKIASLFGGKKVAKISSGIVPDQKKQTPFEALSLWIRGNIFIPDARVLWVKPSVRFLENYIQENNIETIITTGPPHSLHLIGLTLKRKLPLRWIADFRDPWTTIGYHQSLKLSASAAKKHSHLESEVLTNADDIIVTSITTKSDFSKITHKPIEVITNGFDQYAPQVERDKKFSIAHIGSLLSKRNPEVLWKVLHELIIENADFKRDFELKLLGAVSREVLDSIYKFKLADHVTNHGYVSHQEALKHQVSSQVLLLIEINSEDTKSIIPGKLFEYLAAKRPILGIGPNGADFAQILKDTHAGSFVTYYEKDKLKSAIADLYQKYNDGTNEVESVDIDKYTRRNLTKSLSKLIENPSPWES